jgi:DNA-binding XRE family transcriptional regulator
MNRADIKTIRKVLNLNQPQLAQLMGVHPITVSKWERGVTPPTAYQEAFFNLFRLAGKDKEVRDTVKSLLITAGVIVALTLIFKVASKR